jgi:hypothetical protein
MTDFKYKLTLHLIILGLLVFIFIGSQKKAENTTKQKVVVPERKGEFKSPSAIINIKGKKDSIIWKDKIVRTENPINKKLAEDFIASQKENDSLKILKLYLDAIEEVDGTYVFNDNYLKLEVATKTRGKILKITPKYTIKEREEILQVKQKETVFALYAGAGLNTTTTVEKLTPEVNLGFQNRKGSILTFKYGITDKSIGIGYSLRIINYKK